MMNSRQLSIRKIKARAGVPTSKWVPNLKDAISSAAYLRAKQVESDNLLRKCTSEGS